MTSILNALFGNWRTTLSGVITAVGTYLLTQPGAWSVVGQVLMAVGALGLGVNSKDASTGSPALKP
jgi:hypothetical protein